VATLAADERDLRRAVHKAIKKVTEDIEERFHFNTAIAAVMELLNTLQSCELKTPQAGAVMQEALESLVLMLAPFVPHITEELWQRMGHATPISATSWPEYDRQAVSVPAGSDEEAVKASALADDKIKPFLEGVQVRKVICVPGKLVNIVVG
jgi:leucyl-tRNA synthetase